jgi:hypothetical protein
VRRVGDERVRGGARVVVDVAALGGRRAPELGEARVPEDVGVGPEAVAVLQQDDAPWNVATRS